MADNILKALESWQAEQDKLSVVFSPAAMKSNAAVKIKLAAYRKIYEKFSKNGGGLAQLLKAEIRNMEKHLYPNRLVRMVERMGANVMAFREARKKPEVVVPKKSFEPMLKIETPAKQVAKAEVKVTERVPVVKQKPMEKNAAQVKSTLLQKKTRKRRGLTV